MLSKWWAALAQLTEWVLPLENHRYAYLTDSGWRTRATGLCSPSKAYPVRVPSKIPDVTVRFPNDLRLQRSYSLLINREGENT